MVCAAEATPTDNYGIAPAECELKVVRSFGQQVKI
jgi:hypothetical protein